VHPVPWQLEQRRAVSPLSLFSVCSNGSGSPRRGRQDHSVQTGYEVVISDILLFAVLMITFREVTVFVGFSNWHTILPAF